MEPERVEEMGFGEGAGPAGEAVSRTWKFLWEGGGGGVQRMPLPPYLLRSVYTYSQQLQGGGLIRCS